MSAHRMKQRRAAQKKRTKSASLNLVSLMDIFTILVFFLMANSSEVEVLDTSSQIELPDSSSTQRPDNRLVIAVDEEAVIVGGRAVARVAEVLAAEDNVIAPLSAELAHRAERRGEVPEGGFEVTIMGDREIPYALLKKIMLTCQAEDFARISLAVNQIRSDDGGAGEAT